MITQCPHCHEALNFSELQETKIKSALANLKAGSLKLGCPHCRQSIALNAAGDLAEVAAPPAAKAGGIAPTPPDFPDIGWLAGGFYEEQEVVEDAPKAMLLLTEGAVRERVVKVLENLGYLVEGAESATDAIAKMRFVNYAMVVLQSGYDGKLADSLFHRYMQAMPMVRRRYIYYFLIGPEFHTLYDLEAMSQSANLVVNEQEVNHLDIILKKGLREYEELFAPLKEMLKAHGKR